MKRVNGQILASSFEIPAQTRHVYRVPFENFRLTACGLKIFKIVRTTTECCFYQSAVNFETLWAFLLRYKMIA